MVNGRRSKVEGRDRPSTVDHRPSTALMPYPGSIVQLPVEVEVGQLPGVLLEVIALGRKQIRLNHADNGQLQRGASGQVHRLVFVGVDERLFAPAANGADV